MSEDWCDKDIVMLYACFQLLKNFVENEKEIIEQIDWEHSQVSKNAKNEIDFLYDWWSKRIDKDDDLDEKQYEEDTLMLKPLIDIKKHLWR